MTSSKLTQEAIDSLVGRTIIEASENWIKLDNGLVIYLEDSEVDMLN